MGNQPSSTGFDGPPFRLAERTWLTEDQRTAVPDGDPRARFLLGQEGDEIPQGQADALGLSARKMRRSHNDKQRLPGADK